jgi:multidrug efflux pump subunit AcrB
MTEHERILRAFANTSEREASFWEPVLGYEVSDEQKERIKRRCETEKAQAAALRAGAEAIRCEEQLTEEVKELRIEIDRLKMENHGLKAALKWRINNEAILP